MNPRLIAVLVAVFMFVGLILGVRLFQDLDAARNALTLWAVGEARLEKTISFGASRAGVLVANPYTRQIFAAKEDVPALARIDATTNNIVAETPLRGYHTGATIDFVNNEIYIAQEFSQTIRVIDGATNQIAREIAVPGGSPIGELAYDSNTNRVYVIQNDIQRLAILDHSDGALLGTLPIDAHYGDMAHNPQTERLYVTSPLHDSVTVVDTSNDTIIATIRIGTNPKTIAINPATNQIYVAVANDNVVAVIDGASNQVRAKIPVGETPIGIAVNPLSNRIYVGIFGNKELSVIDGNTNRVLTTLPVGVQPHHVTMIPELERVYLASDDGKGITWVQDSGTNPLNQRVVPSDTGVHTLLLDNRAAPANWQQIEFDEQGWQDATQTHCLSNGALPPYPQAEWIWLSTCKLDAHTALFRKTFDLPSQFARGTLRLRADDMAQVYLNGHPLGRTRLWTTEYQYDLTPYLRAGKNVLAIQVENTLGYGRMIFRADVAMVNTR